MSEVIHHGVDNGCVTFNCREYYGSKWQNRHMQVTHKSLAVKNTIDSDEGQINLELNLSESKYTQKMKTVRVKISRQSHHCIQCGGITGAMLVKIL